MSFEDDLNRLRRVRAEIENEWRLTEKLSDTMCDAIKRQRKELERIWHDYWGQAT